IAGTGKLWLINSNLIGNTSGSYGGGAYLGITNQFLMYGGEVRDNQASGVNHGGGLMIWINTSGFIRGTSFINNTYQGGDSHIGFATGGDRAVSIWTVIIGNLLLRQPVSRLHLNRLLLTQATRFSSRRIGSEAVEEP